MQHSTLRQPDPGLVPAGPRLALSAQRVLPTAPTDRGLGGAERSYSLGGGLVLLSWPHAPGVQAVERGGQLMGWIEDNVVDPLDAWVAVVDGRLVTDADDGQPLLSMEPQHAMTLLGLALEQHV